jgi:hypothetical protein
MFILYCLAEINKLMKPLLENKTNKSMEVVMQMTFGQIRLDDGASKPILSDVNRGDFLKTISDADRGDHASVGKGSARTRRTRQRRKQEEIDHEQDVPYRKSVDKSNFSQAVGERNDYPTTV